MKAWWKRQLANITAWKAHYKIGTNVSIPVMLMIAIPLAVIFKQVWIAVTIFAFLVGVFSGYEVCQNHLETGKVAIIAWLNTRLIDSFGDVVVASFWGVIILTGFILIGV